jgi:hypothetical protein
MESSRYQRKQEEKKMTRMEMIKELEDHGIMVNKKANTDRVTKKYFAFKEDQRKKKDKKSIGHVVVRKISRQRKQTIQRRKERAIAEIGRHVVPRYRAERK